MLRKLRERIQSEISLSNNTALIPPDPDGPGSPLELPGPTYEEQLFRECPPTEPGPQ